MTEQAPIPVEREVIPIPADQVTPQMRANAMFSPENIHPGAFKAQEVVSQPEQEAGAPDEINENAITREEMLKIRDQAQAEAAQIVASESEEEEEAPPIGHPNNDGFSPYQVRPEETQGFNPEDAAVRTPLTAEDIASKRSGEYPTQDQVDGINAAQALGEHLH